jgi:hypothetical protein
MCLGVGDGADDTAPQKLSYWQRFVASVQENGPKYLMVDVSRAKLQELDLAVLLSYGWVSNCNMFLVLTINVTYVIHLLQILEEAPKVSLFPVKVE